MPGDNLTIVALLSNIAMKWDYVLLSVKVVEL
jgi:hypothetical protein